MEVIQRFFNRSWRFIDAHWQELTEGGGMGSQKTEVAPKDWTMGHDVDRSSTQYKLTPHGHIKSTFLVQKISN